MSSDHALSLNEKILRCKSEMKNHVDKYNHIVNLYVDLKKQNEVESQKIESLTQVLGDNSRVTADMKKTMQDNAKLQEDLKKCSELSESNTRELVKRIEMIENQKRQRDSEDNDLEMSRQRIKQLEEELERVLSLERQTKLNLDAAKQGVSPSLLKVASVPNNGSRIDQMRQLAMEQIQKVHIELGKLEQEKSNNLLQAAIHAQNLPEAKELNDIYNIQRDSLRDYEQKLLNIRRKNIEDVNNYLQKMRHNSIIHPNVVLSNIKNMRDGGHEQELRLWGELKNLKELNVRLQQERELLRSRKEQLLSEADRMNRMKTLYHIKNPENINPDLLLNNAQEYKALGSARSSFIKNNKSDLMAHIDDLERYRIHLADELAPNLHNIVQNLQIYANQFPDVQSDKNFHKVYYGYNDDRKAVIDGAKNTSSQQQSIMRAATATDDELKALSAQVNKYTGMLNKAASGEPYSMEVLQSVASTNHTQLQKQKQRSDLEKKDMIVTKFFLMDKESNVDNLKIDKTNGIKIGNSSGIAHFDHIDNSDSDDTSNLMKSRVNIIKNNGHLVVMIFTHESSTSKRIMPIKAAIQSVTESIQTMSNDSTGLKYQLASISSDDDYVIKDLTKSSNTNVTGCTVGCNQLDTVNVTANNDNEVQSLITNISTTINNTKKDEHVCMSISSNNNNGTGSVVICNVVHPTTDISFTLNSIVTYLKPRLSDRNNTRFVIQTINPSISDSSEHEKALIQITNDSNTFQNEISQ